MHDTALAAGKLFFETYGRQGFGSVVDVGSQSVNGGLRPFAGSARYVGLDLEAGPNVDLVLDKPGVFPLEDASFDAAITTSVFEHDPFFWRTFLEMARVVRPGGLIYVNAPSNGEVHRYPFDCWRFYPDAGKALALWAEENGLACTLVESFLGGRMKDKWTDTVMVFVRDRVEAWDGPFMADRTPGAHNVWKVGAKELTEFRRETEDMRIIRTRTWAGVSRDLEKAVKRAFRGDKKKAKAAG